MKKFNPFILFTGLLLASLIYAACEKEDAAQDQKIIFRAPPVCTPSNPTWSDNHPCPGADLIVTFCVSATCGHAQIQYETSPGVWVQVAQENPLTGGCLSATLTAVAAGTYHFRAQYTSSGMGCSYCNIGFTDPGATYSTTVVPCCDPASFSYFTADNLNIIFSLNAASPLTGATVEFTFPQVLNLPLNGNNQYVAPDGKVYSVNNPTNQTVFTWTGDVGCTTGAVTFTFSFMPDCGAGNANDGQAIIWTDTKVNGVSVKGALANIVYMGCPQ